MCVYIIETLDLSHVFLKVDGGNKAREEEYA